MIKKYFNLCMLLDDVGPMYPRLEKVQKIIQEPDFSYQESCRPKTFTNIFLRSSYWLDRELFDETILDKTDEQELLPMQQVHLKMLNIGSILIDKGFPLEYHPEDYNPTGPAMLASYVKTFVGQCHRRHQFLLNPRKIRGRNIHVEKNTSLEKQR